MKNLTSVLIIGLVWPEPNSSAAGGRMLQLIRLFQEQCWKVTFASAAQESDFMFDLNSLGVATEAIELNASSFDAFVKELNPTMVLFDRFVIEEQFGWRVVANCPEALRVLDTEDLHCLRIARQTAWRENREFVTDDLLYEPLAKREIASVLRCDISLIIAEYEMDLLQSVFKMDASLLYYLPLYVDSLDTKDFESLPSFSQRTDFVFIGNFLHEPNWNAVLYLKETIWPTIRRELTDAKLKIYGAYPSQKVHQLHNPNENFLIMGRAANAKEVISDAKVLLAPLRFGAGIKGKLLEAMQLGTPSGTTPIGAESMKGNYPWNGFIEVNSELFASKAIALYNNESLWKESQKNGVIILNSRFLKESFTQNFIAHLETICSQLEQHRKANFLGGLLQHHTLASSKYLSLWIEEKNK